VVYTDDDGWRCRVGEPMDVPSGGRGRDAVAATTGQLAGRFERFISAAPSDWHMFQAVWEADLAKHGREPGDGARRAAA
jgi:KDO2-lipid IV(A) lauroyltransferase